MRAHARGVGWVGDWLGGMQLPEAIRVAVVVTFLHTDFQAIVGKCCDLHRFVAVTSLQYMHASNSPGFRSLGMNLDLGLEFRL